MSPPEGGRPEDGDRELPDLEPEFVEALEAAENEHEDEPPAGEAPETDSEAEPEPAFGGAAADPPPEQPTEERPAVADPDKTVEFTPEEVSEAQGESGSPDAAEAPEEGEEPDEPVAEEPPAEEPAAEPEPEQAADPTVEAAVPPPPPPARTAAAPGIPQKPPPEGDHEEPPKRKRVWLSFSLGSLLIVASVAGAVAASILLEVKGIAEALQPIPKVKRLLQKVEGGEAQNILVLGSDRRASEPGTRGLSDTTILLRLDPNNNAIALLNIPRDLKTYIPGVGTTKFNAAYAYGGPKLTLRVVKNITDLPINHVVNVDFLGFIRAINAIECVYIDVDRRYFHSNAGLPPELQYAEINIQPGYQRLCGKDALEYVRYRHTDTDLVRAARQQDFLREARGRVPVSDLVLPGERDELIDIFTKYTSSDIDGLTTMLDVLDLFIASRNAPIKEVRFPAILHPSYVTASQGAIEGAVNKFLGIQASGGPRGTLDLPSNSGETGIAPEERKRAKKGKQGASEPKAPPTPSLGNDGLVDASQFSKDLAKKVARKTLRSFPVFYPRRLPSGTIYAQVPRVYKLRDTKKNPREAYKTVMQIPAGDYFGVQGIHDWTDPPILGDPSETRTMGGREYDIYLEGDRVRMVSWEQGDNVYWVSNSLLLALTNDQMLGVARSIGKVPGERVKRPGRKRKR
jgi:LCP family protein required for cell wall assembly